MRCTRRGTGYAIPYNLSVTVWMRIAGNNFVEPFIVPRCLGVAEYRSFLNEDIDPITAR